MHFVAQRTMTKIGERQHRNRENGAEGINALKARSEIIKELKMSALLTKSMNLSSVIQNVCHPDY
ncbi:hypothetical protein [Vibrio nigripulchritudo]|uniref:hypothetical protein n=1 Tax=Vibrio nigripulchritudo TaxID=28173 RepID=UPI00056EEFE7|nr:hypothetical protein [Vibrio nigripulchritudo]